MGDDERRPALHQPRHRPLDEHLGPRVDRRRRLVEDEDRRVGEERPGDRQELLLAGREVRRVVVDDRVVAVGQRPHEVVDVGGLGGGQDLVLGRVEPAVGDVLADRAVEQPRVLEDHPELAAQVVAGQLAGVDAVDRDPPAVDLVEAHQQVDERRLAGAGRADDRDRLAGRRRRGRGRRSAARPARSGTTRPRRRRRRRPGRARPAGTGSAISSASSSSSKTRSAEATADCRTLTMLAVWMIGNVNWREYWMKATTSPSVIWPGGDAQAADDRDRDVVQVRDERHRRLDDPGDELGPVAGVGRAARSPASKISIASRWRPNALTIACPVCISSTWPLSAPVDAHWATNCCCDRRTMRIVTDERRRHGEQRDDREDRADRQHQDQHADDRQERRDQLGQALLERLADVVDVVGDAAEQVAARVVVEVAERQPAELLRRRRRRSR